MILFTSVARQKFYLFHAPIPTATQAKNAALELREKKKLNCLEKIKQFNVSIFTFHIDYNYALMIISNDRMGSIRGEILLGALQLNNYYKVMAITLWGVVGHLVCIHLCYEFVGWEKLEFN